MKPQPPSRLQASFQTLKSFVTPPTTGTSAAKSKARIPAALKNLQRLIHPPLPLTPRESQKLLTELTGSFRRQLAASSVLPLSPDLSDNLGSSPSRIIKRQSRDNFKLQQAEVNPADVHIGRLLEQNRLKGWQPESGDPIIGAGTKQTSTQRLLSHPLEVFEDHVWAGTATSQLTATCLRIYVNQLLVAMKGSPVMNLAETATNPKPDGALVVIHLLRSCNLIPKVGPPLQDPNLTNWLTAGLLLSSKPSYPFSWVNHCLTLKDYSQAGAILWAIVQAYTKIYDEKSAIELFLYIIGHTQDNMKHTRISQRINPKALQMFQSAFVDRRAGPVSNLLNKVARKLYERTSSESLQKSIVEAVDIWNPSEPGLTAYLMLKHFRDPYPGLDYLLDSLQPPLSTFINNQEEYRMLGLQIAQEFYRKDQPFLAETAIKIVEQRDYGIEKSKKSSDNTGQMKINLEVLIRELAKTVTMQNMWSSDREGDLSSHEKSLQF